MKYFEKKYQELISDMQRAHDNLVTDLKYHINYLQRIIKEQDEKIEKLERTNKLQKEIDEYNRLEAQRNINLEDEITRLRAELAEAEEELKMTNDTIEARGDYKSAEPLIKDEKVRKAVRAWAEVVGKEKTFVASYNVDYHDCCIYIGDLSSTAMIDLGTDLNISEGSYTITELIGEEEE